MHVTLGWQPPRPFITNRHERLGRSREGMMTVEGDGDCRIRNSENAAVEPKAEVREDGGCAYHSNDTSNVSADLEGESRRGAREF